MATEASQHLTAERNSSLWASARSPPGARLSGCLSHPLALLSGAAMHVLGVPAVQTCVFSSGHLSGPREPQYVPRARTGSWSPTCGVSLLPQAVLCGTLRTQSGGSTMPHSSVCKWCVGARLALHAHTCAHQSGHVQAGGALCLAPCPVLVGSAAVPGPCPCHPRLPIRAELPCTVALGAHRPAVWSFWSG